MEAASGAEKSRSISRVSLIGEAVVDRRDCKKGWGLSRLGKDGMERAKVKVVQTDSNSG